MNNNEIKLDDTVMNCLCNLCSDKHKCDACNILKKIKYKINDIKLCKDCFYKALIKTNVENYIDSLDMSEKKN